LDSAILRDIHRFWFGELRSVDDIPADKTDMWWRRSETTDGAIRERFGATIPEAARTDFDLSALAREEAVALVVLFDQFPRNIFRNSPEAFAYDAHARAVARRMVEGGLDRFFPVERAALAIPFEHSEAVADQDLGVMLFARLAVEAPPAAQEFFRNLLDYGTRHRDVIRRFGRFPHRNAVLGRPSTADESAFLAEHPEGF